MFILSPITIVVKTSSTSIKNQPISNVGDILPLANIGDGSPKTKADRIISYNEEREYYNSSWNFFKFLQDNPNEYRIIWEPWKTKAAVHSIVVSDDGNMVAFGGGYLYDNEIHIFRWNYMTKEYEKIWDSGDGIIKGDVVSLAIGDTDNNRLIEIVAASTDGHVYVFEQRHIFDPITNTENMFDLVWVSPFLGPVWSVKVFDLDQDYLPDIIAGTWENEIHIFEYYNHSGYPYSPEHWIDYREVWNSGDMINSKILSIDTGDFNGNGLYDLIVGTRDGWVYVFENNGTVIDIHGIPFPLPRDNNYRLIWFNNYSAFAPIFSIDAGDADNDGVDEASIVAAGQEAYILDYNSGSFEMIKLFYPIKSWEASETAPYPVDYWVDWMIEGTNVYYYDGTKTYEEPIDKSLMPIPNIYYNNTAMAGPTDGQVSLFMPNGTTNATAVLDFGAQEELVGDGGSGYDMCIVFKKPNDTFLVTPDRNHIRFYLSVDGVVYDELTEYSIVYASSSTVYMYADVDKILNKWEWRFARYIKIEVFGANYSIDSIEAFYIERQLSDAVSTLITSLNFEYGVEKNYVIFGTIAGKLVFYAYNETIAGYEWVYDTYDIDGWNLGTHIWDIKKTKTDTKYPYWIKGDDLVLLSGDEFYSYFNVDYDNDGDEDFLITTTNGLIRFVKNSEGEYVSDSYSEDYIVGDIEPEFSGKNITVAMIDIFPIGGPELLVSFYDGSKYRTYVYYLESPYNLKYNSSIYEELPEFEESGKFETLLKYADCIPEYAFGDVDGDGKSDLVVAMGKLYLLKNVGTDGEFTKYVLVEEYFDELNSMIKSKIIKKVQLVDFNLDGVLDVVVSFANRNGATYFENIGTASKPVWVEKRQLFSNSARLGESETNFGLNGYTEPVIISDDGYIMIAYNRDTKKFTLFYGETALADTLLLATYPLLEKVNLGPASTEGNYLNFGYHVIEVWSTRNDLRGWTQAIYHADVDGDGKGEIVVGDYDNNVYIFEHMVNNTYKRAFRSFDLHYDVLTNVSPYYSEEFEGMGQYFKRRVWEHARFVVADTDINNNSKKEIIVATQYNVYIFEHVGYENYELICNFSLLDHKLSDWISLTDGITAFAYAGDMDYDGLGEIVLAADQFLLVYQLQEDGSFVETYLVGEYLLFPGRDFLLPGSPTSYYYWYMGIQTIDNYFPLKIKAIVVSDIDRNGQKEIIVGGVNATYECGEIAGGFLYAIETQIGTYYLKWTAPQNVTYRNPIYALEVADQDYDGYRELIVGSEKGIVVFENSDNSYLVIKGVMTSNPNFPYRDLSLVMTNSSIVQKGVHSQDIVISDNGIIYAFVSIGTARLINRRIYMSFSKDNASSWQPLIRVTNLSDYPSGVTIKEEFFPSAVIIGDLIYIAWYAELQEQTTYYAIYYKTYNMTSNEFSSAVEVMNFQNDDVDNLRAWYNPSSLIYGLSLSYMNKTDGRLYILVLSFISLFPPQVGWISISFDYIGEDGYKPIRHDIVYFGNYTFGLVFTGYYEKENTTNYDVWFSTANTTFEWSTPTRIVETPWDEITPTIAYHKQSGSIVVVYTAERSASPYDLYLVKSDDNGYTWSEPVEINRMHPNITMYCEYTVRYKYYSRQNAWVDLLGYFSYEPATYISSSGFLVYSILMKMYYYWNNEPTYDFNYGVHFVDNIDWIHFKLGASRILAVGDTDLDAKYEIVTNYYDEAITIFELYDKVGDTFLYNQTYISFPFNNTVNDISIGDSNGNMWPEIAVSCDMGNVYLLEFTYFTRKPAIFEFFNITNSYDLDYPNDYVAHGAFRFGAYEGYYIAYKSTKLLIVYDVLNGGYINLDMGEVIKSVFTFDTDGDGFEEFYISLYNGTLVVYDLDYGHRGFTNRKDLGTYVIDYDVRNGIAVLALRNGYVIAINTTTLEVIRPDINLGTTTTKDVVGLLSEGDLYGVAVKFSNGTVVEFKYSDSTYVKVFRNTTEITDAFVLETVDINEDGVDDLVFQNKTDEIVYINGETGEVIDITEVYGVGSIKYLLACRVDDDDYLDLIFIGENARGAITLKNFEPIWLSYVNLGSFEIKFGDFDSDGLVDFIAYDSDGRTVIYNSYGFAYLYYQPTNYQLTYFAIGSTNYSKFMFYGLLENSTFVVGAYSAFYERATYLAYLEPRIMLKGEIFKSSWGGKIIAVDINKDGVDELVISNGTFVVAYSVSNNELMWRFDADFQINYFFVANYTPESPNVIIGNLTTLLVLSGEGSIVDTIDTKNIDYVRYISCGDFDKDGYDELIIAFVYNISVFDYGHGIVWSKSGVYVGFEVGDFDGNGLLDVATKMTNGTLYVYEPISDTLIWKKPLGTSGVINYQKDFFKIDYYDDGYLEIAFTNISGEIDILKGANGNLLTKITTGYKTFGVFLNYDDFLGKGGLIVKLYGVGIVVYDGSGHEVYKFGDGSRIGYKAIDVDGDGLKEYFSFTGNAIFSISSKYYNYYIKAENIIDTFEVFEIKGEPTVALLTINGMLKVYSLKDYTKNELKNIEQQKEIISSIYTIYYLALPIAIIIATMTVICMRKKKCKKPTENTFPF